MAWPRGAWAGALALLAVAVPRAATRLAGHGAELDAAVLVQRALRPHIGVSQLAQQVTEVHRSLESVLSKRGQLASGGHVKLPGIPFSLLSLHASAATGAKWYDMDDDMLLQKLQERIRANEEKEEEEEEERARVEGTSADGTANGTASPSTEGTSLGKARTRKTSAKEWLTKSDLDNFAEDERRLLQLNSELQRIAVTIARIAVQQRELGMHLGLPDPATAKFEVGDKVELQVGGGTLAGNWVKATIIGLGDRPDTYNLHVPSIKKGSKDMANVAAIAIRKDEDADLKVFEPGEAKYEVGEEAQVQTAFGPYAGSWVKCIIKSKADLPDTYNIHVSSAAPGHRDVPSVPARILRKAESKALFAQYDMDGDGLMSDAEFKVAMREKATTVYLESKKKRTFQDGEEIQILKEGVWVNCTVMGEGDLANSFNVFVPSAAVGFQYEQNVVTSILRKYSANATDSESQKLQIIPEEADHEVLVQKGPFKGKWVPCQLKSKSDDGDSYTIWMPYGAPGGVSTVPNVASELLRERRTCGEGFDSIFDADSPGYDHFGRQFNPKSSSEECAADCTKRFQCKSYEWSPMLRECHLNQVGEPSLNGNGDYLYCVRRDPPKTPGDAWRGPWIGQEMQYLTTDGEHSGEWHRCFILGYAEQPDYYSIAADVAFLNLTKQWTVRANIPSYELRYAAARLLPSLADSWEPPSGDDALWIHRRNSTAQRFPQAVLIDDSQIQEDEAAPANGTEETAASPEAADTAVQVALEAALEGGDAALTPDSAQHLRNALGNATAFAAEAAPGAEAAPDAEVAELAPETADSLSAVAELTGGIAQVSPVAASAGEPTAETPDTVEEPAAKASVTDEPAEGMEVSPAAASAEEPVAEAPDAAEEPSAEASVAAEPAEGMDAEPAEGIEAEPAEGIEAVAASATEELQRNASTNTMDAVEESTSPQPAILDADGIEGDVGESVEVKVYHGPHAGAWVPAVIKGKGTEPDSYNIFVPTYNSADKVVSNVAGSALRKTSKKVVIDEELKYPHYAVGERAEVVMPLGRNSSVAYKCTVTARGSARNTYDLEVPSFGLYQAVHARHLQKVPPESLFDFAEEAESNIFSLKGVMELALAMEEELLPVLKMLVLSQQDLRAWMRRTHDWHMGCDSHDRTQIVDRLQELATLIPDAVAEAVPEECSLPRLLFKRENFWDDLSVCMHRAMDISSDCANCGARFLLSTVDRCTTKCTPMMMGCRAAGAQGDLSCQLGVGRCMECLQSPVRELIKCADFEDSGIVATLGKIGLDAKAGKLDVEGALRSTIAPSFLLSGESLAKAGLRTLLLSWKTFVSG